MQNKSQIIYFNSKNWAFHASMVIQKKINKILLYQNECTVMLTGGRSAEKIYNAWSEFSEFQQLSNVHFFFTDERCVSLDSPENIYSMVMRTLFKNNIPKGCSISRIEADVIANSFVANKYAEKLPLCIDIILLGLGDDGHIASLFPGSKALNENIRSVVLVDSPKFPHKRITITPAVIKRSKFIFMLASGSHKRKALSQAFSDTSDINSLPAILATNAIWLLDQNLNTKFTIT